MPSFILSLSIATFFMLKGNRFRWADVSEEPMATSVPTVALISLLNCSLTSQQLQGSRNGSDKTVVEALGLKSEEWSAMLRQWKFIDHCEIAVPPQPGISLGTRNAQMLVCQLVLCELDDRWQARRILPCGTVAKGLLAGFHRSFVNVLSTGIPSSLLKDFARSTLGVHDLMTFEKHVVDILVGLGDLG